MKTSEWGSQPFCKYFILTIIFAKHFENGEIHIYNKIPFDIELINISQDSCPITFYLFYILGLWARALQGAVPGPGGPGMPRARGPQPSASGPMACGPRPGCHCQELGPRPLKRGRLQEDGSPFGAPKTSTFKRTEALVQNHRPHPSAVPIN